MGDEYMWAVEDDNINDFKHYFDEYWREQEAKEELGRIQSSIPDNITLRSGPSEMLRVTPEGFYVRGVRVEADADEARKVYSAFKQWLTWSMLNGEGK